MSRTLVLYKDAGAGVMGGEGVIGGEERMREDRRI